MTPSQIQRKEEAIIRKVTRAILRMESTGYLSDTVFEFLPTPRKQSVEVTVQFTKNNYRMKCILEFFTFADLPRVDAIRQLFDGYYREYANEKIFGLPRVSQ